ncbi:Basic-leucine zipper transcription factor family protein, putative isoform 4 [Hibiscus syriacus]|uniref:Basic-leucine zipper transcription factor family protein, putative isoform 4 n=1 Tax=Hibiscus syriacus TaxID=106335 RepID=A0A6A2YMM9_HIBSY|nr:Basic-leucine zipper transcription factor family protein, putative isoform 4 [Hibiscus syriacus]
MYMDEFLTRIWNAKENLAIDSNGHQNNSENKQVGAHVRSSLNETSSSRGIAQQSSLPRQASLTLPAPLCRKTVDEVWSEIQRGQQGQGQSNNSNVHNADEDAGIRRQSTFGETTLEDLLIKAGVVREQCMLPPTPAVPPPPQYGLYQTSNSPAVGSGFVSRPVGFSGTGSQTMPPSLNDGKNGGSYQLAAPPLTALHYNGKVAAASGYGPGKTIGVVAPMSPVSSERICANQVDNPVSQYGMAIGAIRGSALRSGRRKNRWKAWKTKENLRKMRRSLSCPL